MKHLLIVSISLIFLNACSLYKSDGRKQFESDAPGKLKTTSVPFQLKGCKKESSLESWFNGEFPTASHELVYSDSDLEVWRSSPVTSQSNSVEIKALQKTETNTLSCLYEFASNDVWEHYRDQFLHELENNLLPQE